MLAQIGMFNSSSQPIDHIDLNARDYPNKEALVDSRSRLTFAQAKRQADRLALGFIELGLKRGQIIIVQLPNIVEDYLIRSALPKAGVVGLYLTMNLRHHEIDFALRKTMAVGVIIVAESGGFSFTEMIQQIRPNFGNLTHVFVVGDQLPEGGISLDKMKENPLEEKYPSDYFEETRIKPGELSSLRVTSGTTGLPKLVRRVGISGSITRDSEPAKRYKVTNKDVFAALAPLSGGGSGPPCRFHAPSQGCKVALLERFDPEEALKLIEREKVTFATGVPAQLTMMVRHPNLEKYDLSSLRAFYYAGAKLPYSIAEEVEEKMGCRIVAHFGGMDVSFAFATSYDDPPEVRRLSVGKLVTPRTKLKLVDEEGREVSQGEVGEIIIKEADAGPSYFKDDEATRKRRDPDGWYHTGDLAKLDEHGNLYIVGRRKDVIIRGGQNVYPAEIEGMLITHPKVVDVAIVSMPDSVMGEKACAYIILQPGQILTFNEMVSFLNEKKIAKHKLPERLEIVDNFPMSGEGQKVLKRKLTDSITDKLKSEGAIT